MLKAVTAPLRQIAENAGKEGSLILQKTLTLSTYEGWDARGDAMVNMLDAGIVDPTKVTRLCIELSASIASLLLTTEAIISEDESSKNMAQPAPQMV
jgi:chaperonin GroEL